MKLVINQNQVGKFNLLGDEESLAFSLAFKDDNNETLWVGKDGLPVSEDAEVKYRAIFSMPRNADNPQYASQWYQDIFNASNYESLFDEHFKHTGFTTGLDYPAQRVMFAYFIGNHYEEIYRSAVEKEKAEDTKRIEQLESELARLREKTYYYADAQDAPYLLKTILDGMEKEYERYIGWRDDYKEGNENWSKWDKRAKERRKEINQLKKSFKEAVAKS